MLFLKLSKYFSPSFASYYSWKHPFKALFGSGALSGKMLLARIVENNKIDDDIGQVRLSKFSFAPQG